MDPNIRSKTATGMKRQWKNSKQMYSSSLLEPTGTEQAVEHTTIDPAELRHRYYESQVQKLRGGSTLNLRSSKSPPHYLSKKEFDQFQKITVSDKNSFMPFDKKIKRIYGNRDI